MEELLGLDCEDSGETELFASDIERYLEELEGWQSEGGVSIVREFHFDSFAAAMEFVNSVAAIAESENHHPDIDIRFDRVILRLSTHSAGELTLCDFIVAARINTLI